MERAVTLAMAKARFINRYTMEHVPSWARKPVADGDNRYYAPQYATDKEWYDRTLFAGESELATKGCCYSSNQTWPLGQWLSSPYCGSRRHAA